MKQRITEEQREAIVRRAVADRDALLSGEAAAASERRILVSRNILARAREHVPYMGETWKALTEAMTMPTVEALEAYVLADRAAQPADSAMLLELVEALAAHDFGDYGISKRLSDALDRARALTAAIKDRTDP